MWWPWQKKQGKDNNHEASNQIDTSSENDTDKGEGEKEEATSSPKIKVDFNEEEEGLEDEIVALHKKGESLLQKRASAFVKKRRKTIDALQELEKKTESFVFSCKISNTVGNVVAIAGVPVAFFVPPVGIGMMVAGGVTSLGTALVGSYIESELKGNFKKVIEKDEAARKHFQTAFSAFDKVYKTISGGTKIAAGATKMGAAVKDAAFVGSISKLGFKSLGAAASALSAAGVVISVIDIVYTWTSKNATLELIKGHILALETGLNDLEKALEIYDLTSIEDVKNELDEEEENEGEKEPEKESNPFDKDEEKNQQNEKEAEEKDEDKKEEGDETRID